MPISLFTLEINKFFALKNDFKIVFSVPFDRKIWFNERKGCKPKLFIDGFRFGLSNKCKRTETWRCAQYRELGFVLKFSFPTILKLNNKV